MSRYTWDKLKKDLFKKDEERVQRIIARALNKRRDLIVGSVTTLQINKALNKMPINEKRNYLAAMFVQLVEGTIPVSTSPVPSSRLMWIHLGKELKVTYDTDKGYGIIPNIESFGFGDRYVKDKGKYFYEKIQNSIEVFNRVSERRSGEFLWSAERINTLEELVILANRILKYTQEDELTYDPNTSFADIEVLVNPFKLLGTTRKMIKHLKDLEVRVVKENYDLDLNVLKSNYKTIEGTIDAYYYSRPKTPDGRLIMMDSEFKHARKIWEATASNSRFLIEKVVKNTLQGLYNKYKIKGKYEQKKTNRKPYIKNSKKRRGRIK